MNAISFSTGQAADAGVSGPCCTFSFSRGVTPSLPVRLDGCFVMGRSVPTWRTRAEGELQALAPFRRALSKDERPHFDALMDAIRQRRTAGGMLPAHDVWPPFTLSMCVGLMRRCHDLQQRIEALEGVVGDR